MLTELSVEQFVSRTASSQPVPGGGSVSALAAALAAALARMVAGLTCGRPKYATVEEQMEALKARAGDLLTSLVTDVDRDSRAYGQVMDAFKLPKDSQDRGPAIQEALKQAARVPMDVARKALEVMQLAGQALEKGNPNARTDAAVGLMMARTAALGAIMNVRINLESIRERDFADRMEQQAAAIQAQVLELERKLLAKEVFEK